MIIRKIRDRQIHSQLKIFFEEGRLFVSFTAENRYNLTSRCYIPDRNDMDVSCVREILNIADVQKLCET